MDRSDFALEYGRLSEQIAHKDLKIRELYADKELLNQANSALRQEVNEYVNKMHKVEAENANLQKELERITKKGEEQKLAMKKLQEQYSKQKITIKVQSDQIAQRGSITKSATTPHRAGSTNGVFNDIYAQPPPAYNARVDDASQAQRAGPPPHPDPMARQPSAPLLLRDSFPSSYCRGHAITPQPSRQAYDGNQLVQIPEYETSIELGAEFTHIFKLTENWTRNYMNAPDPRKDDAIPPDLRASLAQYTNAEIAMRLMSSGSTRYFAIAKLINYKLSMLAFRPMLVKGFTPYYDKKISEMRSQFYSYLPIHIRRALMTACAETFSEMTKADGFQRHMDKLVTRQVYEMWTFLEPLFAPGVARNEAWNDLGELWKEAARIGVLMLLKPAMFDLGYPPVGPSSIFNPAQMVNRDLNFRQDPQTLSQMAVSIRLAITPVVTEIDYMSSGMTKKILHYSNVLIQL